MVRGFGAAARGRHRARVRVRADARASPRWRAAGRAPRRGAAAAAAAPRPGARRRRGARGASTRGAAELASRTAPARALRGAGAGAAARALAHGGRRPGRVLAVGLAAGGRRLGARHADQGESDIRSSCRRTCRALRDLHALQQSTGVGGEIDVMVSAATSPTRRSSPGWPTTRRGLLKRYGYSAGARLRSAPSCARRSRCRTSSRRRRGHRAGADPRPPRRGAPYFSQGVLTPDRRTATLAFGIRLMPLDRQQSGASTTCARGSHPPAGRDRPAGRPPGARRRGQRRGLLAVAAAQTLLAGLVAVRSSC